MRAANASILSAPSKRAWLDETASASQSTNHETAAVIKHSSFARHLPASHVAIHLKCSWHELDGSAPWIRGAVRLAGQPSPSRPHV